MTIEANNTAVTGIPRIGDRAPDFTATTTKGDITFSEWQGASWVVLFSHPADFTPVCTTELAEFARRQSEFAARNTKLIGLSIDSIHSHLAWLRNINERLDVQIDYPLIADLNTAVAQKYGMIHPGASATATVRAVFVIDPQHTIRALIYYPLTNGRNIDEILRLVDSLQASDSYKVATPVNWRPGDKVIVPAPRTEAQIESNLKAGDEVVDFYLVKKSLN
ncbi:MAG TPA: peroxiredoxin [Chloroflexia bacterium]|nr:peroxiredoxin [Chloroflexia bacterium]